MNSTYELPCKFQLFDNYSLNPVQESDSVAIATALSDTQVTKNLRIPKGPVYTEVDALEFIRSEDKYQRNDGQYVIVRYAIRKDEDLIGMIDMKTEPEPTTKGLKSLDLDGRYLVLGYWISADYQKKGIMSKAVEVLCQKVAKELLDCKYVVAGTFSENLGSQKVLKKNGFSFIREIKDGIVKLYPKELKDEKLFVKVL